LAIRLKALIQKVFPASSCSKQRTLIFHHGLHAGNILVEQEGPLFRRMKASIKALALDSEKQDSWLALPFNSSHTLNDMHFQKARET